MVLGYHYHVPVLKRGEKIFIPSYIGVFIHALAERVTRLILFLHEDPNPNAAGYDFEISMGNIEFCSLGKKTKVWERLLFPHPHVNRMWDKAITCDAILVRAPSPIAPQIFSRLHIKARIVFLVVGDYRSGATHLVQPWYRLWAIKILLNRNNTQQCKEMKRADVVVNSQALYDKYKDLAKTIHITSTTSISSKDFFEREDTCQGEGIKLLFTGRLDPVKGLKELVEAAGICKKEGLSVSVHFVAWEDSPEKPFEKELLAFGLERGLSGDLFFHGKKPVGEDLNKMYRMADIYVIPSYHEGFPRTIWEALANSLPVIATPVGGIPHALKNRENVLFTEVCSASDLALKIKEMMENNELRRTLIKNGRERAKEETLEVQTSRLVDYILTKL